MKWIFILILLVNLAVFGLGYQSELSSPEMVEVVYPVVGNLRLLPKWSRRLMLSRHFRIRPRRNHLWKMR